MRPSKVLSSTPSSYHWTLHSFSDKLALQYLNRRRYVVQGRRLSLWIFWRKWKGE
jgi:hypothetical protein